MAVMPSVDLPPDALIAERICDRCGQQLVRHCRERGHWPPCCPGLCRNRQGPLRLPPSGEWRRVQDPIHGPRWEIGPEDAKDPDALVSDATIRTFGRKWVERILGRIGAPPLPEQAWEADR